MILFKPEHVAPILAGEKTQTRRLGRKRWNVGATHQAKTNVFKAPFARLRILSVRSQRLKDMAIEDAHREGYPTLEAYQETFIRIYGSWIDELEVWVIDFELARAEA